MRKGARELHALHLTSFLPAAASALVLPAVAGEPGSSSSSANSGSPTGSRRAGSPSQVSISMLDLRYKDVRLEALWQAHRAASLQGLDCSALALCGTLQLLSLRRQWRYTGPVLQLFLVGSATASLTAAWCSQRRPRAFRRRRRAYLAACKLALMLTTAAVAATQHSRLSRPATRYWQCIMFALLYGRGLFLGMSTLFLQGGFLSEALVTAVVLPVLLGEVHIMCKDRTIAAPTARRIFAELADALSRAADSFPLPLPAAGWRLSGFPACMAVHALLQVAAGAGALMAAYFLEFRARAHFAAQRGRPIAPPPQQQQQLDLALQLVLGWLVLLSAVWKAAQALGWAAG